MKTLAITLKAFSCIRYATKRVLWTISIPKAFGIRYSIFLFLIFTLSTSIPAQEWTEPVNISNLGGYSMDPDMVIDHDGVIHVVWSYRITQTHWMIMYNYSEDDGLTWTEPIDLLQNTDLWMLQPHIASDSKNKLYVTYTHDGNSWTPEGRLIKMLTYDDHQWSEPIVVSEGMPDSHYNFIIIDYNDRVYVSWDHGPSGDDYVRYLENNTWSKPFCPYPGGDEIYALVDAAVDNNNSLYWMGASAGITYYGERLQYFYYDYISNIWYPPEKLVNDTIQVGLDIALNNNELPESAYRKRSTISVGVTEESTNHIKKEGNYWGATNLVAVTGKHQEYQQIIIDQNNDVNVVETEYYASSMPETQLVHYYKTGNIWTSQPIDYSNHMCHFPKLLFVNNRLYVVYRHSNASGTGDLRFSKYDIITKIEETNQPTELKIYPNPGRDKIYFEFENNATQHINLSVFDMTGQQIITLIKEIKPRGTYRQIWNVTDKYRKENAPRLYLVRLQSGRNTVTQTVEIIK